MPVVARSASVSDLQLKKNIERSSADERSKPVTSTLSRDEHPLSMDAKLFALPVLKPDRSTSLSDEHP